MEKSGIPHAEPTTTTSDHKVVQRSVNREYDLSFWKQTYTCMKRLTTTLFFLAVGFANGPVNLISDAERKKICKYTFTYTFTPSCFN